MIVTDADGVLYNGNTILPSVHPTLKAFNYKRFCDLFQNKTDSKERIQFYCLTNGGNTSEKAKAEQLNQHMAIENEASYSIKEENVICNFTPLKTIT